MEFTAHRHTDLPPHRGSGAAQQDPKDKTQRDPKGQFQWRPGVWRPGVTWRPGVMAAGWRPGVGGRVSGGRVSDLVSSFLDPERSGPVRPTRREPGRTTLAGPPAESLGPSAVEAGACPSVDRSRHGIARRGSDGTGAGGPQTEKPERIKIPSIFHSIFIIFHFSFAPGRGEGLGPAIARIRSG